MKSNYLAFLFILIFSFFLSACSLGSNNDSNLDLSGSFNNETLITESQPSLSPNTLTEDDTIVALKTQNGQIVIRLFPQHSPNTVKNFLNKVNSGFYDGLTFHRVEPNFVVQGGDPRGDGTGGGTISSEINSLPFTQTSVGMARGNNRQLSNDSQFFICLSTESCQHLTGEYVNFGQVISGFEFVENIKVGDQILEITTQTK